MRRVLLAALVVFSGCHIVQKDSYWEDAKAAKAGIEPEGLSDERANFPWLGVRIPEKPDATVLGATVLHVFGSSPASRAGLEPKDEIRSIGGAPVRSALDVRLALRGVAPLTSLVYAREGQEHEVLVSLVRTADYLKERRRRVFSDAAYSGTSLPFFFNYVTRELTPDFVRVYYGADVKEPVLVYKDVDVFPLWYSGISVWRRETLFIWDSSRSQVVSWPMRFTTDGQERTEDLNESIPAPPVGTKDL